MPGEASRIPEGVFKFKVRYSECDPMGVMHHARYFDYLELGRTELLRENGHTYKDMESGGEFFVVARAEAKYIRPIRYDDEVYLTTRIAKATRAKIEHTYEMRVSELLCFTGRTTLACVNCDGQLVPLPERFFL